MTIEKGGAWGEPVEVPPDCPEVGSDRELAALAAEAAMLGQDLIVGLGPEAMTGDVARTLGIAAVRPPQERLGYRFDLGFVALDENSELPFVAHVTAHRRFWNGEFAVAMNCAWVGDFYLGPRAHPNDGLLDYTTGRLDLGQRVLARRRVKTGSHLPHPGLKAGRRASWEHVFDQPIQVFIDGHSAGRHRSIRARLESDCFTVIV